MAFPPRSASRKEEMEKRSRQRVRDQVAHLAFGAETRMRSKRARISMMARSSNPPPSRPDTEAQDQLLQIITFGLQRAAGPYRRASNGSLLYSITSSAVASSVAGTVRPSAFAVLRLMTS